MKPPEWALAAILAVVVLFSAQAVAWCGVADTAQVQYDRGAALEKQGKHTEAIAEWQNLLTQYPQAASTDPKLAIVKAATSLGIGEAQRQSDQLDAAKATFTQLLSDYPQCRGNCVDATIGIAKISRKTGDTLTAIQMYIKVLSDYPDKVTRGDFAIARLGEMPIPADLQAKLDSAIAVCELAQKEEEDITAIRRAAIAKATSGDKEGAKADLLVLAANPAATNSCARLRLLAMAQLIANDKANARLTYDKLLARAEGEYDPEAYTELRVETLFGLGDRQKVLDETAGALQSYGDGPAGMPIMYYRARTLDLLDRTDECLQAYQALISRYDPVSDLQQREKMSTAMARLGDLLVQAGRNNEARAMFQRAVTQYPETPMAVSAANSLRDLDKGGRQ